MTNYCSENGKVMYNSYTFSANIAKLSPGSRRMESAISPFNLRVVVTESSPFRTTWV